MGNQPGKLIYQGALGSLTLPRYTFRKPTKDDLWRVVRSRELFRLVLSAIWLIIAGLLCSWTQSKSDERWVLSSPDHDTKASPPLYDALWAVSPYLEGKIYLTDIFVMGLMGVTVVCMLLFVASSWVKRAIIFRRIFWIMGALYWYRAITLTVTTLPATHQDCPPVITNGFSFGGALKASIDMIFGGVKACTDNIFSGHTMFLMTCVFQWRMYCRFKPFAWLVYAIALAGILLIDFTRLHYTVDIVLAMFITWGAYTIYFACLNIAVQRLEFDGHLRGHYSSSLGNAEARWDKYNSEFQDIVYIPRMLNSGIVASIAYLDGLDLRWNDESLRAIHQGQQNPEKSQRDRSESQVPLQDPSPEVSGISSMV